MLGAWGPWGQIGEKAVWSPLDVSVLEQRMEIWARESELEVRGLPAHLTEPDAGQQWPGCPSGILPTAEVTPGSLPHSHTFAGGGTACDLASQI